ncbi:MAG: transcription antitermination factor NusB [Nitrospirota bacterium]|jgi:N utilization substance protein B
MGARHKGRELAVQFLYGRDYVAPDWEKAQREFLAQAGRGAAASDFADRLLRGLREHVTEVETALMRFATDRWPVERMGQIDRAILKLGLYELLVERTTPPRVVIDEAIDLAKAFCDADGYRFVNGILDAAMKEVLADRR